MVSAIFVSQLKSDYRLGNKLGLRWKRYDEDWSLAQHEIGVASEKTLDAMNLSNNGHALERKSFPEALAIWNRECFERVGDVFYANGFLAVRNNVAQALMRFDMGEGGLIPLPIYREDLVTPENEDFFLVNFGARKNSLIDEESKNFRKHYVDPKTGRQVWQLGAVRDGDIVLSPEAAEGPDLWNEERIRSPIFMTQALAAALREASSRTDLRLAQCCIKGV